MLNLKPLFSVFHLSVICIVIKVVMLVWHSKFLSLQHYADNLRSETILVTTTLMLQTSLSCQSLANCFGDGMVSLVLFAVNCHAWWLNYTFHAH